MEPTTIPPLTIKIVSSGGTLSAGQNHTLTCQASGGRSMAYIHVVEEWQCLVRHHPLTPSPHCMWLTLEYIKLQTVP